MKRIGGLFDDLCDVRTLTAAAWRAARGKRHRREVNDFLGRLEAETAEIGRRLRDGNYRFSAYRKFRIRDPKTREIHAPPFRDRVVHHAIVAVTGPVFERGATDRSFACRRGMGQHAALAEIRRRVRRTGWFLKLDVARYYDSIDQGKLRTALARRFRERRLLALFDALIDSHAAAPGAGLPIGALTSQYLGNFFLDPIDHWVLSDGRPACYVRYMDDLVFLGGREDLIALRDKAFVRLAGLGLTPKDGGVLNRSVLGIPFLGFTLYPDRVRLNRAGRRRLRRKLKAIERARRAGETDDREAQERAASLFAHAAFADDVAGRREMVAQVTGFFDESGDGPRTGRPCPAGRVLDQHGQELPRRHPQQEHGGQPQQEQRVPGRSVLRHGGAEGAEAPDKTETPPDDARSRARLRRDEPTRQSPPAADTRAKHRPGKGAGGAAILEDR